MKAIVDVNFHKIVFSQIATTGDKNRWQIGFLRMRAKTGSKLGDHQVLSMCPSRPVSGWDHRSRRADIAMLAEKYAVLLEDRSAVGDLSFLEDHGTVAVREKRRVVESESRELYFFVVVEKNERLRGLARRLHRRGGGAEQASAS